MSVHNLLARWREWRRIRRERWVEKQAAKRTGDPYSELWKSGGSDSGGASGGM
jgi:hypothetical protein